MLFPYAPLPPPLDLAGTKRNLPFLLELAKTHEVSVLSFGTEAEKRLFLSRYGHMVSGIRVVDTHRKRWANGLERLWLMATLRSPYRQLYRPEMQAAIDDLASTGSYDLIHCCVPMFGYYRFPACVPVTSDTHEVKFDLLRKTALHETNVLSKAVNFWCARLGELEEPRLWRRFDALFATTDVDRQRMVAVDPSLAPVVVQNGAGDEFFAKTGAPPEPRTMVFTGLFTHRPNAQGIEYFLSRIFPQILERVPDAKIYVVGKSPPPWLVRRGNEHVVVTGYVSDVRPYIHRAEVFVIPLLSGGGIRGKALEAMAMGKPIVTTTVGVEGIHLQHRESALFADTPSQFADSVVELFDDAVLRASLADRAAAIASQRYTWAAKGKELDEALVRVVGSGRRRPGGDT